MSRRSDPAPVLSLPKDGRRPEGGHAGPPLRNTSMGTGMPVIHASMTNAGFSSFVCERKFMKYFVEVFGCLLVLCC